MNNLTNQQNCIAKSSEYAVPTNGNVRTFSNQKEKKIVFTGGGTGGHVYPNVALFDEFEKRGFSINYVGRKGESIEQKLSLQNGVTYHSVDCVKLVRSFKLDAIKNNLSIPFTLAKSIKQATAILKNLSPTAVFSKGGFVSLPTTIASLKLKIPTFCHESDHSLGLANKIGKMLGATVLKANPQSKFKGEFVGMPMRKELFRTSKTTMIPQSNTLPVLLVVGGSLGASDVNNAVKHNFVELTSKYFVIHVTGNNKGFELPLRTKNYVRIDYADNIAELYHSADVVLSRAGATAVFEISALKLKAVFVPLPKGISRGDQIYNARLAQAYGATILCQDKRFLDNLLPSIQKAYKNPPMRAIQSDANGKIADIVCDSIRRGEICNDKKLLQNGLP